MDGVLINKNYFEDLTNYFKILIRSSDSETMSVTIENET